MNEKNQHQAVTLHIPKGWFTALCKAFLPLKHLHGLKVESSAISQWAYAAR